MPNYYDDGAPPEQTSMPAESESPEQAEEKRDSEQTALIPSSLCPGMDVGDVFKVRVVSVQEDEYAIAYENGQGDKTNSEDSEPSMSKASESNESSGYFD